MEDYLAAEAERVQIGATIPEFEKILPAGPARFYQIENKMDAVLHYDLASAPGRRGNPLREVSAPGGRDATDLTGPCLVLILASSARAEDKKTKSWPRTQ